MVEKPDRQEFATDVDHPAGDDAVERHHRVGQGSSARSALSRTLAQRA